MKTIQTRANGAPVCTVCSSPHADAIRDGLSSGESATSLAQRFGVSVDALGRHRRAGHDAARLIVIDPDTAALGLIDSTVDLLRMARTASEIEYSRGNHRLGAQISDSALRAIGTLRDLGIDSDSITADIADAKDARRRAYRLAKAFDDLVDAHPELAPELAEYAEARGLPEVAALLRDEPEAVTQS
ncbi:hypothetical protein CSIV_12415 [Microbacterium sp. CSI-V]|uniref:hypothetical protein n=1 Tax=unclassified Microbacterium TaxID=2609290 RepID=UPI00097CABE8|nr:MULTISPECIES: hypothetical protein [unclassified Microbacterium]MXS73680.1 hypothetical protein [Microbacterium sp. TL13]ONI62313.1 hypothetical protein CSIV_12415 [Microbacterium sp. CSI-V]